jgi:hypothetical protein
LALNSFNISDKVMTKLNRKEDQMLSIGSYRQNSNVKHTCDEHFKIVIKNVFKFGHGSNLENCVNIFNDLENVYQILIMMI